MEVDQFGICVATWSKLALQLDVERMFKERMLLSIPIFRDYGLQGIAAFSSCSRSPFGPLLEHTRMGTFPKDGYCQLQVTLSF
jgi:hypothetical protein